MKKVLLLIAACILALPMMAQTDSVADAIKRIEQLEQRITSLDASVQEVLKQNLALKMNLNLKPTIAKSNIGGVEFRVLEVTGDPTSGEVHLLISSDNITDTDKYVYYDKYEILDELGHGYNENNRAIIKIEGVSNSLINDALHQHPNTPLTLDMTIKNYNPESKFIKFLSLKGMVDYKPNEASFQNLPIKWVAEEN